MDDRIDGQREEVEDSKDSSSGDGRADGGGGSIDRPTKSNQSPDLVPSKWNLRFECSSR